MPRVISWNVLYRAYEEKYKPGSKILLTSEEERIIKIIKLLREHVDENTVICLQEVSTQVILSLVAEFKLTHRVFSFNIREDEHLVTLAPKDYKLVKGFSHATSNGYLYVSNGTYNVINCHLIPQRFRDINVLEYLTNFLEQNSCTIIAGDFNERQKIIEKTLNTYFNCPRYGNTYKKRPIDNIIFSRHITNYTPSRILQNLISDHHMVKLDFE